MSIIRSCEIENTIFGDMDEKVESLVIQLIIPKAKAQILFPQIRTKISDPEQENVTTVELDYIEIRTMIQQLAEDRADELQSYCLFCFYFICLLFKMKNYFMGVFIHVFIIGTGYC